MISQHLNSYNRRGRSQRKSDEELQRIAKKHDFKGATRFPKEVIQVLETISSNYARSLTNTLSVRLGAPVQVQMQSISQMKYLDYMLNHQGQIATCVFALEPMTGPLYLNINTQLAFLCIDSICGGRIDYDKSMMNRKFTEVEKKLVEILSGYCLYPLRQSAKDFFETEYVIKDMEFNLSNTHYITDHENVIAINLVVELREGHSFPITIIMPYHSLGPIFEYAKENISFKHEHKEPSEAKKAFITKQLESSTAEMRIILGESSLSVAQVNELKVGDVINLGRKFDDLLPIETEGRVGFYAQPGTHDKNKLAVQIVEIVEGDHR